MIPAWSDLDARGQAAFRTTVAFLNGRLADQATIDWALGLTPARKIERIAIKHLLDSPGQKADEPWATAWRLIEESWSAPTIERSSTEIYRIQKRLRAGDRSGSIILNIVGLVAPRLKVEPIEPWRRKALQTPRRPKSFDQLLSATLTSGGLVDLNILEAAHSDEVPFLMALANALESAVNNGLDIARRLGWDGQGRLWQLGGLARVYYPFANSKQIEDRDPDAYHRGIAPSVRLLCAVVARISEFEAQAALSFVRRWEAARSVVDERLWAAAARNPELASPAQIATFLSGLDDRHFWDLHAFPEIAELRALRFGDLDLLTQKAIAKRLRKGPPRNHWPRSLEAGEFKEAQLYWAVRELKRIVVAGGILPPDERAWMDARIVQFGDLTEMPMDEGFQEGTRMRWVPPDRDLKFDGMSGAARLRALEAALSTSRSGWDDDPAARANDWLQRAENAHLILNDLNATGNGGEAFPRVWNRFGWAHSRGS